MPILLAALLMAAAVGATASESGPKEPADRASYSLGHQVGRDLALQSKKVDARALLQGLLDGLGGAEPALSREEMDEILAEVKRQLTAGDTGSERMEEKHHREKGREFLLQNASRKGIVTLKSGLQYEIIRKGDGPKPGPDDKVVVRYRGRTIDGSEFHDSSRRPGGPETLHVRGVIRGFTEALQLMPVGSTWRLFVPPELAYGRRGPLGHRTLIFELELIGIGPQAPAGEGK